MTCKAASERLRKLLKLPDLVDETFDLLADVRGRLSELERSMNRPEKPEPPPLVAVLVEGTQENGHPGTMGGVALSRGERHLEAVLMTQIRLADCRVTVFCDFARVEVCTILYGNQLLTTGIGACPMAFFPKWEPGVNVTVQAQRRKAAL